jgi:hypothetical protein
MTSVVFALSGLPLSSRKKLLHQQLWMACNHKHIRLLKPFPVKFSFEFPDIRRILVELY